ncbi:MAG: hypothetical protein Udaeo2_00970 [Candidatus Udaeobacter sp.]|nr:MAG: hypothetical protein Udaeo2_00970 [Candidatus Udaeobacter sp.]
MCDLAVAAAPQSSLSAALTWVFLFSAGVALSRNVLRKAAFEMLVTGEFISAEEAKVRGLINRVVEPEQLDAEVEKLVAAIIANRVSLWRWERNSFTGKLNWHCFSLRSGCADHGLQYDG